MKKIILLFLSVVMCLSLALTLSACDLTVGSGSASNDSETKSAQPNSGSLDSVQNGSEGSNTASTPTSNSTQPTSSGSTESSAGGSSTQPQFLVKVSGVADDNNYSKFVSGKAEKEDKRTEFYDRDEAYVVGDDNAFDIPFKATFVRLDTATNTTAPYTPAEWKYIVAVSFFNTETSGWVLLEGADFATYIEAYVENSKKIDFTSDAVGHSFKIQIYPDKLTPSQLASIETFTKTYEVSVVDGYNVYTAIELGYAYNVEAAPNSDDIRNKQDWADFKLEKGLSVDYHPKALILQADIAIQNSDIPSEYFYAYGDAYDGEVSKSFSATDGDAERTLGSLLDCSDIYYNYVADGDRFEIIGNYFKIDASNIAAVSRSDGKITAVGKVVSHSQLFRIKANEETSVAGNAKSSIKNVNFIGNSPKSEDVICAGGLILVKAENVEYVVRNNLATRWYITYFPNFSNKTFLMDSCKAYDGFNSIIYNWGSYSTTIKDCEFIGAGGPVIIADHTGHDSNGAGGRASDITVINSKLESFICGNEGWFNIYNATSIVGQIAAISAVFEANSNMSYVKVNSEGRWFINLIALYKSGSTEGMTDEPVSGYFKMNDAGNPMDFGTYPTSGGWQGTLNTTSLSTMITTLKGLSSDPIPLFVNSAASYGALYFNGTSLASPTGETVDSTHNLFNGGEQLYMYYNGMGIAMGYFTKGQTL